MTHVDIYLPELNVALISAQLDHSVIDALNKPGETIQRILQLSQREPVANTSCAEILNGLLGLPEKFKIPYAILEAQSCGVVINDLNLFYATPVNLQIGSDHLVLNHPDELQLTEDEANALIISINQYLSEDGVTLIPLSASSWIISSLQVAPRTFELADVIGRNVHHFQFAGDNRAYWMNLLSEIQMMLHEHPVNNHRQSIGKPVINSLWFWGEGDSVIPQCQFHNVAPVITGFYPWVKSLADRCHMQYLDPEEINYDKIHNIQRLIIIDGRLKASNMAPDQRNLYSHFSEIYVSYFSTLINLLWKNKYRSLTLHLCNGYRYTVTPLSRYKFWKYFHKYK